MISVTESAAPVRFNPLFPQGAVSPPLVEANTARALNLKDGQVVQAMVQSQGDQLALLLRGRLIGVPHLPDWEIGQRLSFKVQVNPDGSVTLHVLSGLRAEASSASASNAYAQAGATQSVLSPAEGNFSRLASLFYHQPGLPDLRQLLAPGGLDALLTQAGNPPALQAQWQAMQLLPGQLSPALIRMMVSAVMGSETSIARASKPSAMDPKQLLYQLLANLAENSEENGAELQQIKRAIADLDSAQVSAVQAQRAGEMAVTLLLPMVHEEPVEINFERKPGNGEHDQVFSVSVHANNADLGELWLKADLHGQGQLDLVMWARQDWVIAQAQTGVKELSAHLSQAGLQMRSFQAHPGERPPPSLSTPIVQALGQPGVVFDLRV